MKGEKGERKRDKSFGKVEIWEWENSLPYELSTKASARRHLQNFGFASMGTTALPGLGSQSMGDSLVRLHSLLNVFLVVPFDPLGFSSGV